jgi:hypothetical protein
VSKTPQVVASRFAAALDAADYVAARALLAEDCVYRLGEPVLSGPEAIIDSYRANGEAARRRFDEVQYVGSIKLTGPSTAVINFTDRLRLGDQWRQFQCRQHFRVGSGALIEETKHDELPNQREQLVAFEAGAGAG